MLGAEPSLGRPQPDPASLPSAVPRRRLLHSPECRQRGAGRCCAGSAEPRGPGPWSRSSRAARPPPAAAPPPARPRAAPGAAQPSPPGKFAAARCRGRVRGGRRTWPAARRGSAAGRCSLVRALRRRNLAVPSSHIQVSPGVCSPPLTGDSVPARSPGGSCAFRLLAAA